MLRGLDDGGEYRAAVAGALDMTQWIIFGISEVVAFVLIGRLWVRGTGMVISRLVWSLVLLVPVLGPVAFLWLRPNVPDHSYECDDQTGQVDPGSHEGGI